jgi:predicted membrane protein DUF2157
MTPARFHQQMRRELDKLLREGLLDARIHDALAARYATSRWDWRSLGRWFLAFGALSLASGVAIFLEDILHFTLEKLALSLAASMAALFAGGEWARRRRMVWTPRSLELLGALALVGLTFTLGAIYSTGSGNWPALLLIDLLLLLPLAYLLGNPLLLVLSAVVFFAWFGGATGYISGWGAYWFGMNYPLRFLLAGLVIIGVGALHRLAEDGLLMRYRGFFKVWLSAGLFFSEMALWLLSLFGNFGDMRDWRYHAGAGELWLFNGLWAGANALLVYLGALFDLRMVRAYGVTFLIIQGYTVFFWHVAEHLGPTLSLLLAGGTALWLVLHLEQRRRQHTAQAPPAA